MARSSDVARARGCSGEEFFAQYNLDVDPLPDIHNGQDALEALVQQKPPMLWPRP